MNGTVDPALAWLLRGGLATLFASAAAHKLRDLASFRTALADYELLPRAGVALAALLLPAVEAGTAVGLCIPAFAPWAGLTAAALLALYGGAMAINLARGRRHIDCGCAGPARRRALGAALVWRNGALAVAALASALPAAPRPLLWVDGLTIGAGLAVLALLYAALDGLLAEAPRLALLRLRHHGGDSRLPVEEASRA
jgi:hypothetical protein